MRHFFSTVWGYILAAVGVAVLVVIALAPLGIMAWFLSHPYLSVLVYLFFGWVGWTMVWTAYFIPFGYILGGNTERVEGLIPWLGLAFTIATGLLFWLSPPYWFTRGIIGFIAIGFFAAMVVGFVVNLPIYLRTKV